MSWVDERNAQIVALRKQGLWPTQIADQMGLNRNQVLGALFRSGLCRRDTDATEIRSLKQVRGAAVGSAKLTEDAVAYIRANYKSRCRTNGCGGLAKKFGVRRRAVWNVLHGKTWKP